MGVSPTKIQTEDTISWYRSQLDPAISAEVHETSDEKAWKQAGGYLFSLLFTAWLALKCWYTWNAPWLSGLFVFLYGMQANFTINAMHELGHGFVFRTKILNTIFARIFSFLGWLHPDMFFSSHFRHHRYTQNFPLDQENPAPIRVTFNQFLSFGFLNVFGAYMTIKEAVLAATESYPTNHLGWTTTWEEICYPKDKPKLRRVATLWARVLVGGHLLILLISAWYGTWLVPVIFSLGPFCGGFLFFSCNATQHVGLHQQVSDFRLNCRTFVLHPAIAFYYWHMNWHTEHHMYASVPCYNLKRLHEAIKHDLPSPPVGILETWKRIVAVQGRQLQDPSYAEEICLPPAPIS